MLVLPSQPWPGCENPQQLCGLVVSNYVCENGVLKVKAGKDFVEVPAALCSIYKSKMPQKETLRKITNKNIDAAAEALYLVITKEADRVIYRSTYSGGSRIPSIEDLKNQLLQMIGTYKIVKLGILKNLTVKLMFDTDPVVLEGVPLGRFQVTIDMAIKSSSSDRLAVSNYGRVRVKALDPNVNSLYVHPHLLSNANPKGSRSICLGEGVPVFNNAMTELRFADAADVITLVLNNYNRHSPYRHLSLWKDVDEYKCTNCNNYYELSREASVSICKHCNIEVCPSCADPNLSTHHLGCV